MYPSGPDQAPQAIYNVRVPSLPFLSLTFINETSLVAAGHDYEPILFTGDVSSGWTINKSLDDSMNRSAPVARVPSGGVGKLNNEAFNRFRAADSRGISSSPASTSNGAAAGLNNSLKVGGERNTVHQNTITSVRVHEGFGLGEVSKLSTSGLDGRVVVWTTSGLTGGMAKLGVR